MPKIKYIDVRSIYIPNLKNYRGGKTLPDGKDNIIEVTETEARGLMRMKNGNNPCFELVETRRKRQEKDIEDLDNGDR